MTEVREENMVVGVANVVRNNAQEKRRSEERRQDLKGICQGYDNLPLPAFMDSVVSFMKDD